MKHSQITLKLIVAALMGFAGLVASAADDIAALMQQLDDAIARSDEYDALKAQRIEQLKAQGAATVNDEERYWIMRSLADEYSVYDSDSAQVYGQRALELAERLGRVDLQNDSHILNAYSYTAAGLLEQGRAELERVDADALTPLSLPNYLGQVVYQITHEEQYRNVTPKEIGNLSSVQAILDSIITVITPEHPDYYYYVAYQAINDSVPLQQSIAEVERSMSERKFDTREDAKAAWILSQLYALKGDSDNHKRYLILSALADVRTGNRDIASLEEMATVARNEGDLQRAYNYICHTLECSELLKNRVRVLHVATLQSEISKAYQAEVDKLHGQRTVMMIVMAALIAILLVAVVMIYSQHHKLRRSHIKLNDLNGELKKSLDDLSDANACLTDNNRRLRELTEQLRDTNQRLEESNVLQVKCIGTIFSVCSEYISKIDDFRKALHRKLRAKQYDEARLLCDTPEMSQNELKEFHAHFDQIFLSVYPTFVDDFNALLPEGEKIYPHTPGSLNTELRIYALVRLGINDSVKIAAILHCSPQTVYNKRMKVRNKVNMPREEFVKVVRGLGKYLPETPEDGNDSAEPDPVV